MKTGVLRLRAAKPEPPPPAWLERWQARCAAEHRQFEAEWWAEHPGDDDAEPAEPEQRTRTPAARAALPPTLPPRLISRDAAAAYVGVSPNTFDKMIADELMPKPLQLTERRLAWDVRQLDAAIDRLRGDGDANTDTDTQQTTDHSWDDIDAQAKTKPPVH